LQDQTVKGDCGSGTNTARSEKRSSVAIKEGDTVTGTLLQNGETQPNRRG
jgi:hypothetical protein